VPLGSEPVTKVTVNGTPANLCPDSDQPYDNHGDINRIAYCSIFAKDKPLFDLTLSAKGWPGGVTPDYGDINPAANVPLHQLRAQDAYDPNDSITGLTLTVDGASGGFATGTADPYVPPGGRVSSRVESWSDYGTAVNGAPDYSTLCSPPQDLTMQCNSAPDQTLVVFYPLKGGTVPGTPNYTGGLATVDVIFNYGKHFSTCFSDQFQSADLARAADACTPPSHTRITKAKITGHTALFRFTARHAKSFHCELFRNQRLKFSSSCKSPKPYANRLPHGKYNFLVAGVGTGGVDRKPAIKKFTIR
jgi:hypothetical protein